MGKRSEFERIELDKYYTPFHGVEPLFPFLKPQTRFAELCAGDGRLIRHLESRGHTCVYACDIKPEGDGIEEKDAYLFDKNSMLYAGPVPDCDLIITNPPWDRKPDGTGPMHDLIHIFTQHADTWMLFDADWAHTLQTEGLSPMCAKIISVGRVQWIEGSKGTGMDNCCWYLFSKKNKKPTEFYFRC